jgi:hypothetical protein
MTSQAWTKLPCYPLTSSTLSEHYRTLSCAGGESRGFPHRIHAAKGGIFLTNRIYSFAEETIPNNGESSRRTHALEYQCTYTHKVEAAMRFVDMGLIYIYTIYLLLISAATFLLYAACCF